MTRITRDTPAHEIDRVPRAYNADVLNYEDGYLVALYPRSGKFIYTGRSKTLWSALNRALREVTRG